MSATGTSRTFIAIFGRRNSGKSSLINAITGQNVAIVSPIAGTTTDPVTKPMEVRGIGAVTFIDTAGFDDEGALGAERVAKTRQTIDKTDIAIVVVSEGCDFPIEREWIAELRAAKIPVVAVVNKADILPDAAGMAAEFERQTGVRPIETSALTGSGIRELIRQLGEIVVTDERTILGGLVTAGDIVMLVMPQDEQAPAGRLILPQVQTIRELLDKKCIAVSVEPTQFDTALKGLTKPPKLVIIDSQTFASVAPLVPSESMLTSFSVLFAGYKGDIEEFRKGAKAIDSLTEQSRVLIAEACTHAPLGEDIGRVKLPRILRNKIGEGLRVDVVGGSDFPHDLRGYDLIIHCGACMFNRRHVVSRIARAQGAHVPITNYGIALAHLTGQLDRVVFA